MTYNKEYIEQLLQRFMDAETTEQEEQFLAEYFSMCDSIPEEWEAYREMLASFTTDAYDFTEEELMGSPTPTLPFREGDLQPQRPRIVKMWPWVAAACVAALLIVFLAPPEAPQPPKGESSIALAVKDSVMPDKPEAKEQQPIIASIEHKAQDRVKKKISVSKNKEPLLAEAEYVAETECVAKTDEPATTEDNLMAEQPTQFKEMEAAFLSHSAPIRERGQQVIHRVAMLQQEQRSQKQFVEL